MIAIIVLNLNLQNLLWMKNLVVHVHMVSKNNEKKKYISDDNKKLYSILFQWEGEAEKVYLTGSFCNWINFYEMEKSFLLGK